MIEIIPEWALTTADEVQIAQLLGLCFDAETGQRSYVRQRPHLRVIHRDQGQITGHIAVLLRAVRLGPDMVDIAGLAEVCTHPNHRGQGIASRLLQTAIRHCRTSPARFLTLFGTAPLYAEHGFAPHSNILTFVDMTNTHTTAIMTEPAQTLMVLPLHDQIWPASAPLDMLGPLF